MAELAAGHTSREGVVADGNLLVDHGVGKVVLALGHGADKDADALLADRLDVLAHADELRVETQRHLAAVGRQMVCDGVLDDTQQLLVGVCGPD